MKRTIKKVAIALFVLLFLICCQRDQEKELTFSGKMTGRSECKNQLRSSNQTITLADSLTKVDFLLNIADNRLILKHINAGFNCSPDSIYCVTSLNKDTIIVQEKEINPTAKCSCLYDLDIEITGLKEKVYYVRFIELLAGNQAPLAFKMDLTDKKSGSYSVCRKNNPWGL